MYLERSLRRVFILLAASHTVKTERTESCLNPPPREDMAVLLT